MYKLNLLERLLIQSLSIFQMVLKSVLILFLSNFLEMVYSILLCNNKLFIRG